MSRLFVWIVSGSGAALLVGSLIIIRYVDSTPGQALAQPATEVLQARLVGNPLLTARRKEVRRWFPGWCFAEIYNKTPSFKGDLVAGCVQSVIDNVKDETGIVLTPEQVRSPQVIAHFKEVYGDGDWWIKP